MIRFGKIAAALALTGGLAACGSPKEEAATPAVTESATVAAAAPVAATPARPVAFAICATCHAVEAGKNGIGPSLAGVFGAKSGAVSGYAYSAAMLQVNLTWDDATLDAYLAAPLKTVPGTKMSYAGMADPAKRAELIAYLKTLK